jgi:DNA-binding MarR family transcriptional regulator
MRRSYFEGGSTGPITYFRGLPIYGTTILAIVHLTFFVVSAFVGGGTLAAAFGFAPPLIFEKFQIWRFLTYGLANDILGYSPIWFIIGLAFFYFFGREVEVFLGRTAFFILYGAIWLAIPMTLLLTHWLAPFAIAGSNLIHLGMFVAFAAIYPGVVVFFTITAKWMAIGYVAISCLQYIGVRQMGGLIAIAAATLTAMCLSLYLCGRIEIEWPQWVRAVFRSFSPAARRRARFRVVPREKEVRRGAESDVDAILDKIAAKGMSSLTKSEREILQRARSEMLKREGKS